MSRLGVPQKAWLGRIPGDACPDLNLKIPDKLGWGRKSPVPNSETLDVPQKQKERQVPADALQGLCLDAVFLLVLRRTSKKQTAQRVEVHMTERSYHLCLQSAFLKCIKTCLESTQREDCPRAGKDADLLPSCRGLAVGSTTDNTRQVGALALRSRCFSSRILR